MAEKQQTVECDTTKAASRAGQLSESECAACFVALSDSQYLRIVKELKAHIPFTLLGTVCGVVVMLLIAAFDAPYEFSAGFFWTLHPLHVLLSALVTTAMLTRYGRRGVWLTVFVGYVGSVGIATVSDCLIPYAGETLLALPRRGLHLGFIEKWWLVNPLGLAGILLGYLFPRTKLSHAAHVLLSSLASLFHITMALGGAFSVQILVGTAGFLFLAVWLPCCTSDIVFPLLFIRRRVQGVPGPANA